MSKAFLRSPAPTPWHEVQPGATLDYRQLSTTNTALRAIRNTYSGDAACFSGIVTNNSGKPLTFNHVYVWYVDGQGDVIWAGDT